MFSEDNEEMDSASWWGHVLCPVLLHVPGSGSVRAIAELSRNLQSRGKLTHIHEMELLVKANENYNSTKIRR